MKTFNSTYKSFKQFFEDGPAPMPTDPETSKKWDSGALNREMGIETTDEDEIGSLVTIFKPLPMHCGVKSSGPITLKVLSKTTGENGKVEVRVIDDLLNHQKVINKAGGVSKLPYPGQSFWLTKKEFDMLKLMPFGKANPMGGGAPPGGGMDGGMGGAPPMGGM